jgi:hypothetical protein
LGGSIGTTGFSRSNFAGQRDFPAEAKFAAVRRTLIRLTFSGPISKFLRMRREERFGGRRELSKTLGITLKGKI